MSESTAAACPRPLDKLEQACASSLGLLSRQLEALQAEPMPSDVEGLGARLARTEGLLGVAVEALRTSADLRTAGQVLALQAADGAVVFTVRALEVLDQVLAPPAQAAPMAPEGEGVDGGPVEDVDGGAQSEAQE